MEMMGLVGILGRVSTSNYSAIAICLGLEHV